MASNEGVGDGFFDTVGVEDFSLNQGPKNSTTPSSTPSRQRRRRNNNRNTRNRKGGGGNHSRSQSPVPDGKGSRQSKSPKRGGGKGRKSQSPHRGHQQQNQSKSPHRNRKKAADMTVICNRVDLWDNIKFGDGDDYDPPQYHPHHNVPVAPYHFAPDLDEWTGGNRRGGRRGGSQHNQPVPTDVVVLRSKHLKAIKPSKDEEYNPLDSVDHSLPNPLGKKLDKYWAQRRRLFSRFDMGIQLDEEGWYSVTPEVIADHVATRVGSLSQSTAFRASALQSSMNIPQQAPAGNLTKSGIILMDAFCGCGGNAIAFGKRPSEEISMVVCVDLDREKLRMAAQNACLYDIPKEKLIFVECNTLFVMEHAYCDGVLQIDKLRQSGDIDMPKNVPTENCGGFYIGGLGMLPPRIDAIFMDPPWGGVDYNALGKNGYCLDKNMKIKKLRESQVIRAPEKPAPSIGDDFFDSFGSGRSDGANDEAAAARPPDEFMNGVDLVRTAAFATKTRFVIYDLPRNTNKTSLGQSALHAGFRGNIKLEEHYLNGRLKTVTAYMGAEYSSLLLGNSSNHS